MGREVQKSEADKLTELSTSSGEIPNMTPFSAEEMASAVSELAKLKKIPITVYMKDGGAKLEEKIRALSERIDFTRKNGFAPSQLSLAVSSPAMARLKIQKQLQIDQVAYQAKAEVFLILFLNLLKCSIGKKCLRSK